MLFVLDDCINKNIIPFQDYLIGILFFLCSALGATSMFCVMIGLYDFDFPLTTRKFWRFLAAIMLLTFTVSFFVYIIKILKICAST